MTWISTPARRPCSPCARAIFEDALGLREFWGLRGYWAERVRWLERAVELGSSLAAEREERKQHGTNLHNLAVTLANRGDLDEAMRIYRQSLDIKEVLGDRKGKAMTLGMMGQALWQSGQWPAAIRSLLQGFLLLEQLGIEPRTRQAMARDLRAMRAQAGARLLEEVVVNFD